MTITLNASSITILSGIAGEWKGAYIINANVIPINVYIKDNRGKLSAVVDYPTQQRFNVVFDVVLNTNSFILSRKSKQGYVMQFKGDLNNNVIIGSFKYLSEQMKDNPGTFQLMKSKAKHIKGYPIPGYSLQTFEDKEINNFSFKGKYVLLDFWATWCPPCVKKRSALEAMNKNYGDRLEIISVSLDKEIITVQDFRKARFPMEWNHAIKPDMRNDPFIKEFVPQGLPYGYLIDPNGKIMAFADELSSENLKQTVERILK